MIFTPTGIHLQLILPIWSQIRGIRGKGAGLSSALRPAALAETHCNDLQTTEEVSESPNDWAHSINKNNRGCKKVNFDCEEPDDDV